MISTPAVTFSYNPNIIARRLATVFDTHHMYTVIEYEELSNFLQGKEESAPLSERYLITMSLCKIINPCLVVVRRLIRPIAIRR